MDSIQEAFLMLAVTDTSKLTNWQLGAVIIHSYNLHQGFKCIGLSSEGASDHPIVSLPDSFPDSGQLLTFKYLNLSD